MSKKLYSFFILLTAFLWLGSGTIWGEQLNEGFEGDFLPEGWNSLHVSGSASWEKYSSTWNYGYNSQSCAKISWNNSNGDNYLITPQLRPADGESLRFMAKSTSYGGTTLEVMVSTTNNSAASSFSSMSPVKSYTSNGTISTSWGEIVIDLSAYAGTDIYIAFRATDNDGDAIYLDEIKGVSLKPEACPKTSVPVASDITTTSAVISWTESGSATQWNLQYKKSAASDWTTVNGLTSTSYELTGLETGKVPYDYQVQADCGGSDKSGWRAGESFKTDCGKIDIPADGWTYSFEAADGAVVGELPGCWEKISSTGYPKVISGTVKHGSNSLEFYGMNMTQILIFPEFKQDLSNIKISFWYKIDSDQKSYTAIPKIGYVDDESNFTEIEAVASEKKTTYTRYEKNLSGISSDAKQFAIKFQGTYASRNGIVFIDSIKAVVMQDCSAPQDVSCTGTTTSTADFSWTANAGVDSYKYCVVAQGADADFSEDFTVTTNAAHVEGLTTGAYTFYVKCACGTAVSAPVNFDIVSCPAVTAVSLTNPLYNGVTVNWTSGASACDVRYKAGAGEWNTDNTNIASDHLDITGLSVGTAYTFEVKPSCGDSWVGAGETYTPAYGVPAPNVSDETDAQATASWAAVYGADSYEYVVMPGSTVANWESEDKKATSAISATLTGLTGGSNYTVYVRSVYGTNKSAEASAAFSTTTVAPIGLTKGEITANSATYSWSNTGAATQYQWKTSKAGSVWSDPISETTATATGLASYTDYTFYVRSYYGSAEGQQSAAATDNFKTEFGVQELGYSQDFYSTSLPTGWDNSTKTCNYAWATSTTKRVGSSGRSVQFYAPGSGYADLVTPSFNLSEDAYLLFQSHNENALTGKVYIKIGAVETEIFTIPESNAFVKDTIDLTAYTGEVAKFIFRGTANGTSQAFYIDNFEVKAKPCDAPTALSKVESSSSVVLSWTDDAASKWNLRWREVGASDWNEANNLTAKNLTLSSSDGLVFGKNYQAQVQAVCTATKNSDWSGLISFGLVCGAAPTVLSVSNRTNNSATLTWDGAENAFLLQTSQDNDTWSDAIPVNNHTYNLTGLNAGTTYYARVQNACGGEFATTSFKTWCGLQDAAELPLNVTSFSNPLPACWEVTFKGEWSGISGNNICFYGTEEQWVVLPAYDIDLNKLSVTFTFTTSSATATFGYLDAPNGEFHAFASQPTSGVELDLVAEASAPKYIAVRYNGGSGDYSNVQISAISIRKTPTCLKPTGVAGTPGVGSASIDWTKGSSETAWNLQYKTGSADWTTVAVTEKPYELTGLEQGVTYKVRVQANCGEELSDWSDEASFTTNCAAIAALPWYADFSVALSNCWTIYAQDETYYKPAVNTFSQDLQISGGKNGASNNVVVLPAISPSLTNAVMSFEYRGSTGSSYAQLEAGYMTDKADASTFTALETLEQQGSFTEARVALNTVPAGKQLAFRYAGASSQGDQYIKNLRILEQVTLVDNANNSDILAAYTGKAADITIGRTIVRKGYYNTICLPFSLSKEEFDASPIASNDLWAFKYAKVENEELLFRIIQTDHIEAGVPYFIGYEDNAADIVNPLFKNVTISATTGATIGDAAVAQLIGIVDQPVGFTAGDKTKLFLAANNTLYWWNGDHTSQLNNFRAYFKVATGSSLSAPRHGMSARIIKEEQETTGIDNTNVENVTLKFLENNQVVIIRNGVKYTIQGQKIQ